VGVASAELEAADVLSGLAVAADALDAERRGAAALQKLVTWF
jgi:hypothetical protein